MFQTLYRQEALHFCLHYLSLACNARISLKSVDRSYHNLGNNEQQRDCAVYANSVAGRITHIKAVMEQRRNQVNHHIRKAEGIASNHPVAVLDDLLSLNLHKCDRRNDHP